MRSLVHYPTAVTPGDYGNHNYIYYHHTINRKAMANEIKYHYIMTESNTITVIQVNIAVTSGESTYYLSYSGD